MATSLRAGRRVLTSQWVGRMRQMGDATTLKLEPQDQVPKQERLQRGLPFTLDSGMAWFAVDARFVS